MMSRKEKENMETKPKDYCSYSGLASTSSYLDETTRKTKKNNQGVKRD